MFIVTAKEMYDIDRHTMKEIGLPGHVLMENAGREIFRNIISLFERTERITVFVGAGNNGGDGFVIARYLMEHDYNVRVFQVVPDELIQGDALLHKKIYLNSNGEIFSLIDHGVEEIIKNSDVIIDSLLGIGKKGALREPYQDVIKRINESDARVISVDIPSGLPADEGVPFTVAVQADYTFIVGAMKMTAVLPDTASYYGEWKVVEIGFSKRTMEKYTTRRLYGSDQFQATLPRRRAYAHKGDHGKGFIIGGSARMPGAITMATEAALVAGAGLVTAGTLQEIIPIIASRIPEAMFKILKEEDGLLVWDNHLDVSAYDAIAAGVGMGRSKQGEELIKQVLKAATCPVLVDADGLYHLSNLLPILKSRDAVTIVTPHAGEMARLLELRVEETLTSPFQHTKDFAEDYGVYVVLKGKYTIITSPDGKQMVDATGNPGLAKGGSGDVLTGIMLAMILQNQTIFSAICNACHLHGTSADLAVQHKHSVYDLTATDIIAWIREVYRMIS